LGRSRVIGRNFKVKLSARRMAWRGGGRVRSSESSPAPVEPPPPRDFLLDMAAASALGGANRGSARRFRSDANPL
jgi:hypothetical protein